MKAISLTMCRKMGKKQAKSMSEETVSGEDTDTDTDTVGHRGSVILITESATYFVFLRSLICCITHEPHPHSAAVAGENLN